MLKQLLAFVLQGVGSVAAVVAGFVAHPIAGWCVLAIACTAHGVALEHEVIQVPAVVIEPEQLGDA
jgi:hypothetical protein